MDNPNPEFEEINVAKEIGIVLVQTVATTAAVVIGLGLIGLAAGKYLEYKERKNQPTLTVVPDEE